MTIRTLAAGMLIAAACGWAQTGRPLPTPTLPAMPAIPNAVLERPDRGARLESMWRETVDHLQQVAIIAIIFGAITWLIRTLIDYRRWLRLVKVQTDVHSKLLDRFTGHDDLLAYIQSPAGSKFLQSSPIALDAGMRSMGAPLGRILWSVQAGVVLTAAGIGLQFMSREVSDEASQTLHAMGVLGVALGLGFVIAAAVAYLLSRKLGLIAMAARAGRTRIRVQFHRVS